MKWQQPGAYWDGRRPLSSRLPDPLGRQSVRPSPIPELFARPRETRGGGSERRALRPLRMPNACFASPHPKATLTDHRTASGHVSARYRALARGALARSLFAATPRQPSGTRADSSLPSSLVGCKFFCARPTPADVSPCPSKVSPLAGDTAPRRYRVRYSCQFAGHRVL